MEWIINNWQFLIGDVLIPILTFIIGIIVGKTYEKRKAKAIVKGNFNNVFQNCNGMQGDEGKSVKQK